MSASAAQPRTRRAAAGSSPPSSRSRRRSTALIVGGVLLVAAALVVVFTSLGGSSGGKSATQPSASSSVVAAKAHRSAPHKASHRPAAKSPAANPAETAVVVLNGTETTGLAHHISADLQQSGYSQATALDGRPPGAGQVTVVQYTAGHQAEAEGVAHSLSVSQVQPVEATVASLAGSAKVVVIVGADKAATIP